MPLFAPFRGIRYDIGPRDPRLVTAPPYDVISPEQRQALVDASDENIVRIDLPSSGSADPAAGADDPYRAAATLLKEWLGSGVLVEDDQPGFTIYRMISIDEDGDEHHTTGVIGALRLSAPDEGEILCHEFTTPKARSDRLDLLAATDANLSPIWGLSPVAGLTDLLRSDDPPLMDFEADGVRHTVWTITDPTWIESIGRLVGSGPIVIADGHHRYETSLAHRDRIRAERGDGTGAESVMCFVVELVAEQLSVGPIHRLVSGLDPAVDLLTRLGEFFEIEPFDAPDTATIAALQLAGALALITPEREYLLRPRPGRFTGTRDLDSSRLDLALGSLGEVEVVYQHGVEPVRAAVAVGAASFGVLLRPVTIDQIVAIADGGERMPPKSTFFSPKPRTGVVLRSLLD